MTFNFGLNPLLVRSLKCVLYALKMLTPSNPFSGIVKMPFDSYWYNRKKQTLPSRDINGNDPVMSW